MEWVFQKTPLWVITLGLLVLMVAAREAGAWLYRRRPPSDAAAEAQAEGYVLSGILGLLALLVAFTFSMSLNRFDARRALVVTEANALGTAYLRTSVLDDPERLRDLLRQYGAARLEFGLSSGEKERDAEQRGLQLEPLIWAEAVRLVAPNRQTALPLFVLGPLNETFDTATAGRAALAARLPVEVLLTLVVAMLTAAGVLGFALADADRGPRRASLALLALFALATEVILDLDAAHQGLIRVPQGAMADTVRLMAPTAVPATPPPSPTASPGR